MKLFLALLWLIGAGVQVLAQTSEIGLFEANPGQKLVEARWNLPSKAMPCFSDPVSTSSFSAQSDTDSNAPLTPSFDRGPLLTQRSLSSQGNCGLPLEWTQAAGSDRSYGNGAPLFSSLSFPAGTRPKGGMELAAVYELSRYASGPADPISLVVLPQNPPEGFHWKAALRESLYFLVFEHAFRVANDPFARYLIWHKPLWHDYFASASHFNMSRWGDGDDFLVNYIGHPMEGAVTGYIQIQNDPKGRALKFSKSSAYWKSRFKAMGWAAVYSAYFEIGPVLSETALGNEGGYTYIQGCRIPCYKAVHRPLTNNTGWVDFIVTPVIGTGWIVLEDAIEREFVDRLAKGDNGLKFKILRSVLSPSRSFANFLQIREPWYRPKPAGENAFAVSASGKPLVPEEAREQISERAHVGIQYSSLNLPMDREGCSSCRVTSHGVGVSMGYRLLPWLAFDSQGNFFPGGGGYGVKGSATEGLFGAKLGRPFNKWGVFATVRPGFIHYDKALASGATNEYESMNRFALDFGGSFEYYISRRGAVRFEVGNTLVRYLTDHADPQQPVISVLSPDYIVTHSNFHIGTGYAFRF